MKLKELHALLQDIAPFEQPKVELEQYPTGAHLASRMLYTIENSYGDFGGKLVADLGAGTGMLSVGAALLGAASVIALDVDEDALRTAQDNVSQFESPDDDSNLPIEFVRCDVAALPARCQRLMADTVIMNPPFGTKRKGIDVLFMKAAFCVVAAGGAVYSLHKSSTRSHLAKVATQQLGAVSAEVIAELRYDLPATYRFHKQKSVDIEVDLWRFEAGPQSAELARAALLAAELDSAQEDAEGAEVDTGRRGGGGRRGGRGRRGGGRGRGRRSARGEGSGSGSGDDEESD